MVFSFYEGSNESTGFRRKADTVSGAKTKEAWVMFLSPFCQHTLSIQQNGWWRDQMMHRRAMSFLPRRFTLHLGCSGNSGHLLRLPWNYLYPWTERPFKGLTLPQSVYFSSSQQSFLIPTVMNRDAATTGKPKVRLDCSDEKHTVIAITD